MPLETFEWYMLLDDRPQYPMTFPYHLTLSGQIEKGPFQKALDRTLDRHPLLAMKVKKTGTRRWEWQTSEKDTVQVDWGEQGETLGTSEDEWIDLTCGPGLRVWVRQGNDSADLHFQFHHSCCDGVGAMQFTADLLGAYAHLVEGRSGEPFSEPLDVDSLSRRGVFSTPPIKEIGWGTYLQARFQGVIGWILRLPTPLRRPEEAVIPEPEDRSIFANFRSAMIDPARLPLLLEAARARNATLNDLLLCSLFLASVEWDRRQGQKPNRRWVRISMPSNLRDPGDELMPATNRVTLSFISRRAKAASKPEELLGSFRQETVQIKKTRRGVLFLKWIGRLKKTIGFLPGLKSKQCFSTVVLSNLGRLESFFDERFPTREGKVIIGKHTLQDAVFVPPFRVSTHASLGVHSYAGQLTISLRCDPHFFTEEHSQEFLDIFLQELSRWG